MDQQYNCCEEIIEAAATAGGALIWFSLCTRGETTTETQRTQRAHREEFKLSHYPTAASNPDFPSCLHRVVPSIVPDGVMG